MWHNDTLCMQIGKFWKEGDREYIEVTMHNGIYIIKSRYVGLGELAYIPMYPRVQFQSFFSCIADFIQVRYPFIFFKRYFKAYKERINFWSKTWKKMKTKSKFTKILWDLFKLKNCKQVVNHKYWSRGIWEFVDRNRNHICTCLEWTFWFTL